MNALPINCQVVIPWQVLAEGAKLVINTPARIGGLKHKIKEKWEI